MITFFRIDVGLVTMSSCPLHRVDRHSALVTISDSLYIRSTSISGLVDCYINFGKCSKTSLSDNLHRSNPPLYQSLYFGPKQLTTLSGWPLYQVDRNICLTTISHYIQSTTILCWPKYYIDLYIVHQTVISSSPLYRVDHYIGLSATSNWPLYLIDHYIGLTAISGWQSNPLNIRLTKKSTQYNPASLPPVEEDKKKNQKKHWPSSS